MERRMFAKQFRAQFPYRDETYTTDDCINEIGSFLQIKQAAFDPRPFQNPSGDAYCRFHS